MFELLNPTKKNYYLPIPLLWTLRSKKKLANFFVMTLRLVLLSLI